MDAALSSRLHLLKQRPVLADAGRGCVVCGREITRQRVALGAAGGRGGWVLWGQLGRSSLFLLSQWRERRFVLLQHFSWV